MAITMLIRIKIETCKQRATSIIDYLNNIVDEKPNEKEDFV